ncbi:MAG TPA: TetR/AcrR family transcriptional regulator [Solirubrobacterales bacterium]|nr:TetR/AcrR family transcriptional regulator [Solirubrobacterales bacterium]
MTTTPWGDSGELRGRRLAPGPGVSKADVELNHRERLYGAMVAVAAEKGYAETTVSDLICVAGVSRTTFYKYFGDKEACFLATLEALVEGVVAVTASRLRRDEAWQERAAEGMETFMQLLVTQPGAARLCVVEADAAGPHARAVVDRAAKEFEAMIASVFEELPEQRGMPPAMTRAMVGAVRKIMQTRLNRRTEGELAEMVPGLIELAFRYKPPPGPLSERSRRKSPTQAVAPGADEPAERIEAATMAAMARAGYAETTLADIAAEAGVSLRTFYATFPGKLEAFEAALLRGRLRMAAATIPAYRRASSWPEAVWALLHAGLAFLEAEPDFARLITVDVFSAGREALEGRDRAIESARYFIEAGLPATGLDNRVAVEAIQSGLYGILAERMRSKRSGSLRGLAPLMIYMTLVPFLGPEEAYSWATR